MNIFSQPPAACSGAPLPPLRGPPPPPSVGVGKFMEEKGTAPLHPLPTPVQGWVASAASRKGSAVKQQVEMKLYAVVPPPKAAIHNPQSRSGCQTSEPSGPTGRSNLRTFFLLLALRASPPLVLTHHLSSRRRGDNKMGREPFEPFGPCRLPLRGNNKTEGAPLLFCCAL